MKNLNNKLLALQNTKNLTLKIRPTIIDSYSLVVNIYTYPIFIGIKNSY